MFKRQSVIDEATSAAADVAEAAIEALDGFAGDVADVAVRGARRTPFVPSRSWLPSWTVRLIAVALMIIGIIAVVSAFMARNRKREEERAQKLEDALADSFPASDPPSVTSPSL